MDLLAAGAIPDPFFGDNEDALQWIGKTDWTYTRSFEVARGAPRPPARDARLRGARHARHHPIERPPRGADRQHVQDMGVRCEGAPARRHEHNRGEVRLGGGRPAPRIQRAAGPASRPPLQALRPEAPAQGGLQLRMGLGAELVTCGIWRPIRLVAFDTARIEDVNIVQRHAASGAVAIAVAAEARRRSDESLRARITLSHEGGVDLREACGGDGRPRARADRRRRIPQLWWPRGMGAQPLYEVRVELRRRRRPVLDSQRAASACARCAWTVTRTSGASRSSSSSTACRSSPRAPTGSPTTAFVARMTPPATGSAWPTPPRRT